MISPDGNFLYASNRGEDTLVVFAIGEGGALKEIQRILRRQDSATLQLRPDLWVDPLRQPGFSPRSRSSAVIRALENLPGQSRLFQSTRLCSLFA